MRELRLYGALADYVGTDRYEIEAETVGEAVRFLAVNFPGVEQHMADQWYEVKAGEFALSEEEIHYPIGSEDVITITPVISGGGPVGRIILGVALIAASFVIPGTFLVLGVAVQTVAFGIGASLALGGISQLLTPTPSTDVDKVKDPRTIESFSFSGIQNVTRQGVPMPIIYGEVVTGSIVASSGLDSYIK